MTVPPPFVPEILNVRAAGRHRLIPQQDRPQPFFRKQRISDADRPAPLLIVVSPSQQTALPAVHDKPVKPLLHKLVGTTVQRVALSDPAKIQLNSRPVIRNCSRFFIKDDVIKRKDLTNLQ